MAYYCFTDYREEDIVVCDYHNLTCKARENVRILLEDSYGTPDDGTPDFFELSEDELDTWCMAFDILFEPVSGRLHWFDAALEVEIIEQDEEV